MKRTHTQVLWFLILAVGGCAAPDTSDEGAYSQEGQLSGTETVSSEARAPILAEIRLAPRESLVFFAAGPGVGVAEHYPLGGQPILDDDDRELDAVELYKRYAPNAAVPEALVKAQAAGILLEGTEAPVGEPEMVAAQAGGGTGEAAFDQTESGQLGHTSQALELGQGCASPYAKTVFSDCRQNWWGGYWAYAQPTFRLDSRVQAVHGSLTVKVTSTYGGKTFHFHDAVAEGEVSNLRFPPGRLCQSILGFNVDCWDAKVTRRVDILDALSSGFNVDVVFYN